VNYFISPEQERRNEEYIQNQAYSAHDKEHSSKDLISRRKIIKFTRNKETSQLTED
jgi:hypothetical protein